jgi:hypothetical protein
MKHLVKQLCAVTIKAVCTFGVFYLSIRRDYHRTMRLLISATTTHSSSSPPTEKFQAAASKLY